MIAAALDHPGEWLRYTPGDAETVRNLGSLRMAMMRCGGGFDRLGFELSQRGGETFVRYNPNHPDLEVPALKVVGQR